MTFVAFDARFLFFLFDSEPAGPESDVKKVELLFETLSKSGKTIVVPTPALAELLVGAGDDGPAILEKLDRSKNFLISPFGVKAAVELAAIEGDLIASGDKRGGSTEPYQKLKFDRQICAIAKSHGCAEIYSADSGLRNFAAAIGLKAISIEVLPSVEEDPQGDLF